MRSSILTLFLGLTLTCLSAGRDGLAPPSDPTGEDQMIRSAVVPDGDAPEDVVADAKKAAAPVPVPPLSHYAALWEKSMFTTNDLPAPELPQGPGFADQLVLAGIYEVDGAVVAVILDKMSAQISEARIGSENENGIRIKSVNPGESDAMTRIQLQKGMQSGWVTFADGGAGGTVPAGGAGGEPGVPPPGMAPQPLIPQATGGDLNGGPRDGLPMPGGGQSSVVQPLPSGLVDPGLPASPNPVLDEVPLPPP